MSMAPGRSGTGGPPGPDPRNGPPRWRGGLVAVLTAFAVLLGAVSATAMTTGAHAANGLPPVPAAPAKGATLKISGRPTRTAPLVDAVSIGNRIAVVTVVNGGVPIPNTLLVGFRTAAEAALYRRAIEAVVHRIETTPGAGAGIIAAQNALYPLPDGTMPGQWGGASRVFRDEHGNPSGITVLFGPGQPDFTYGHNSPSGRGSDGFGSAGVIRVHQAFPVLVTSTEPVPANVMGVDQTIEHEMGHHIQAMSGIAHRYNSVVPEWLPLWGWRDTPTGELLTMGTPQTRAAALGTVRRDGREWLADDAVASAAMARAVSVMSALWTAGDPAAAYAVWSMVSYRTQVSSGAFSEFNYTRDRQLAQRIFYGTDRRPGTAVPNNRVLNGTPGSDAWIRAMHDFSADDQRNFRNLPEYGRAAPDCDKVPAGEEVPTCVPTKNVTVPDSVKSQFDKWRKDPPPPPPGGAGASCVIGGGPMSASGNGAGAPSVVFVDVSGLSAQDGATMRGAVKAWNQRLASSGFPFRFSTDAPPSGTRTDLRVTSGTDANNYYTLTRSCAGTAQLSLSTGAGGKLAPGSARQRLAAAVQGLGAALGLKVGDAPVDVYEQGKEVYCFSVAGKRFVSGIDQRGCSSLPVAPTSWDMAELAPVHCSVTGACAPWKPGGTGDPAQLVAKDISGVAYGLRSVLATGVWDTPKWDEVDPYDLLSRWSPVPSAAEPGQFDLVNQATGQCLDATSPGSLRLWRCGGVTSAWHLKPQLPPPGAVAAFSLYGNDGTCVRPPGPAGGAPCAVFQVRPGSGRFGAVWDHVTPDPVVDRPSPVDVPVTVDSTDGRTVTVTVPDGATGMRVSLSGSKGNTAYGFAGGDGADGGPGGWVGASFTATAGNKLGVTVATRAIGSGETGGGGYSHGGTSSSGGGSGGGSSAVCRGAGSCHNGGVANQVLAVAGGGGGGGGSTCAGMHWTWKGGAGGGGRYTRSRLFPGGGPSGSDGGGEGGDASWHGGDGGANDGRRGGMTQGNGGNGGDAGWMYHAVSGGGAGWIGGERGQIMGSMCHSQGGGGGGSSYVSDKTPGGGTRIGTPTFGTPATDTPQVTIWWLQGTPTTGTAHPADPAAQTAWTPPPATTGTTGATGTAAHDVPTPPGADHVTAMLADRDVHPDRCVSGPGRQKGTPSSRPARKRNGRPERDDAAAAGGRRYGMALAPVDGSTATRTGARATRTTVRGTSVTRTARQFGTQPSQYRQDTEMWRASHRSHRGTRQIRQPDVVSRPSTPRRSVTTGTCSPFRVSGSIPASDVRCHGDRHDHARPRSRPLPPRPVPAHTPVVRAERPPRLLLRESSGHARPDRRPADVHLTSCRRRTVG